MLCKMKTDGIILDVDGTIWDTTSIVAGAWNEAIASLHLDVGNVDSDVLKTQFGKTMKSIADSLWPSLSEAQKAKLMAECCKRERASLALLNTREGMSALDICFTGVAETIKRMKDSVPFFIVSNCQKGYIEMVIEKMGLAGCIRDYECYGNTGHGKADNIRALCGRCALHHPLYIGDTAGDAAACKEAGVTFVWASYGFGQDVEAEYRIDNFAQIQVLLERVRT